MSTEKQYTCAEVGALADESWLNGALAAHVLKVESIPKKAGGNFWKAVLGDAAGDYTGSVSMSLFMAPRFQQGDRIRISGKGIKKGSYQGKPQIGTGKDTAIEVVAGEERIRSAARGDNIPVAVAPVGGPVAGQTVGMAVKEALALQTHGCTEATVRELVRKPAFWEEVHATASDIIRLSRKLEAGDLAPERADDLPY